jgi:hypothetical protein
MYKAEENVIGCRRFKDVEAGALRSLTKHNFTSPDKLINTVADTGAMNSHTSSV